MQRFQAGLTHSLYFSFWNDSGVRTPVNSPIVDVYTPHKNKYISGAGLSTTSTVGKYRYDMYVTPGVTEGHWFAMAVGLTNSNLDTIYSDVVPFEVVDVLAEPYWVGLEELRQYMELDDTDDRDQDGKLRQALQAAIELVEGYTQRTYGLFQYSEIIQVKDTDRVKLKKYPINSIVGITATFSITPRDVTNLANEVLSTSLVQFYYRLDSDNGIVYLTDPAGFDMPYDNMIMGIDYIAGYATVPEPVRQAVLGLAAAINSFACTEGLSMVKIADVNFTPIKELFSGRIGDMLAPYRNNFQV